MFGTPWNRGIRQMVVYFETSLIKLTKKDFHRLCAQQDNPKNIPTNTVNEKINENCLRQRRTEYFSGCSVIIYQT